MIKKRGIVLWGAVGMLLIALGSYQVLASGSRANLGTVKDTLSDTGPAFTLNDLQGQKFSLSETKGKPVMLIFSTTWCPYCIEEIPHLKKIFNDYASRGVVILNIDVKESREKVARFAEKHRLPYRVLLDETTDVAQSYGVRGVPTLVLLDQAGTVVCRECSSVEPQLDQLLNK